MAVTVLAVPLLAVPIFIYPLSVLLQVARWSPKGDQVGASCTRLCAPNELLRVPSISRETHCAAFARVTSCECAGRFGWVRNGFVQRSAPLSQCITLYLQTVPNTMSIFRNVRRSRAPARGDSGWARNLPRVSVYADSPVNRPS